MVKTPAANAGEVTDVGSIPGSRRILWTEEPGRLQSGVVKSWTQLKQLSTHTAFTECSNNKPDNSMPLTFRNSLNPPNDCTQLRLLLLLRVFM